MSQLTRVLALLLTVEAVVVAPAAGVLERHTLAHRDVKAPTRELVDRAASRFDGLCAAVWLRRRWRRSWEARSLTRLQCIIESLLTGAAGDEIEVVLGVRRHEREAFPMRCIQAPSRQIRIVNVIRATPDASRRLTAGLHTLPRRQRATYERGLVPQRHWFAGRDSGTPELWPMTLVCVLVAMRGLRERGGLCCS